jgi:thiol:disulfide interchange protein
VPVLLTLAAAPAFAADAGGGGARWLVLAAAAVLLVGGALAGRVFVLPQPVGTELSWPGRVRRALGALAMAFGAWLAVAGATTSFAGDGAWVTDFEKGTAAAKERGGPVIVDAWAEWCAACKEIFADTLTHPDVAARLDGFTRIKLDMDLPQNEPLYARYGFENLPWVAVFDSHAALVADKPEPRLVVREAIGAEEFLARLEGKVADDDVSIGDWLAQKGLALTLLLVFLGGVAVSFTPCVVPVYILTVNVIGARRASSAWARLGLSSVYVLGLALTYSVLGVVAGLSTASMGAAFRNPAVVGGLAALFIVLSLFYLEIFRLPQAGGLAAKITGSARSNVLTAFLLGMAGGLIAAPCVGPMLLGILTWIGTQKDAWLGFWLMFTFAVGMGLLFLAIGTSTALLDRVRKAGAWGYRLEMVFAVAFLAIGIYYLRQAVPALGGVVTWLGALG